MSHQQDLDLVPELGKRDVVVRVKRRLLDAIGKAKRTKSISYLLKLALQPVEATRFPAVKLLCAGCSAQRMGPAAAYRVTSSRT